MTGGVLNSLNTRLDASSVRFILEHGESRLLFYDTEFEPLLRQAVQGMAAPPVCVAIVRQAVATQGFAGTDYESLIAAGDPDFDWRRVDDEWDAISLDRKSVV